MIHRKDALNLISQLSIKLVSVPYSLIMVGMFVRHLPNDSDYLLLSAQNYIVLTGLAQLGLGGFMLRRISHSWAETHILGDLPEVRGAFLMSSILAGLTAGSLLLLALAREIPGEIVPILILSLIGLLAIIGDYVRVATGDIARLNLITLGVYVFGAVAAVLASEVLHAGLSVCAIVAFGPPYFSSIFSFCLLFRREDFRKMIRYTGPKTYLGPLRDSFPILMTSVGFAAILNAPLAHPLITAFPALDRASLACLRLFSSGLNVFFFALQPLIPIILRYRYRPNRSDFEKFSLGLLAIIVACSAAAGIVFWIAGPTLIHLWLGGIEVPAGTARDWGIITFLWLTITTFGFYCQATSRPALTAISLLIAAATILIVGIRNPGWTVNQAIIMGLATGVVVGLASTVLAATDPRRNRAPQSSPPGITT